MVLEHPAYSPDLASSEYHLFGPLKDVLRGRRFTSDEGVKKAVHEWLAAQPKTFFYKSKLTFCVICGVLCFFSGGNNAEKIGILHID